MPVGPGGINANGVYLYGEDDSAAPFSDMLNLGMDSVSTQFTNDRGRLTSLETTAANPNVYVAASATARDAKYGDPAAMTAAQRKTLQDRGVTVYRTDLGIAQRFLALYNASTNPTGAAAYGYYPVDNTVFFAGKRNNTGVSIPNSAYTVVSFNSFYAAGSTSNTETIQLSSATVPQVFTVRVAGWYRLSMNVPMGAWSSTGGGARAMASNRNSTTYSTGTLTQLSESGTTAPQVMTDTATVLLAAGDQIRFWLYQDSGAAATNNDTNFSIEYLRPAQI
jgi:hypothetical protein